MENYEMDSYAEADVEYIKDKVFDEMLMTSFSNPNNDPAITEAVKVYIRNANKVCDSGDKIRQNFCVKVETEIKEEMMK